MPILSGNQQKKKFAEKKIRRINYKKLPKQDAHCFSIVLFDIYNAITHNKKTTQHILLLLITTLLLSFGGACLTIW